MSFQNVQPASGLSWLTESVQLILKNPAPFLLMGLLVAVINMVPIVGGLAFLVLGPALYGGIIHAAREQDRGGVADFQHLFQAFREEGKLGKMLMLCLPNVVAMIIAMILIVVFAGGAILGLAAAGSNGSGTIGAGLGFGAMIGALLAIAVMLAAFALTFFAIPQVMLGGAEPVPAMKESLQASLANVLPLLLFVIVLFVALFLAGIVLGWIPLVGMLVIMVAVVPIYACASYAAWRQVFRNDITQEIPPAPPAMPL